MKDPNYITYKDLIKESQRIYKNMLAHYPRDKQAGGIYEWTSTHRIACLKTLIKMLKAHERDRQGDLFEMFQETKKK